MYIFKYAYLNIKRGKGRNILIGIIITAITISACVALTINKSGNNLVNTYIESNPLEVSFNIDPNSYRNASEDDKTNFTALKADDVTNYGNSEYVTDYYYTLESALSSSDIEPISYDEMFTPPADREGDDDTTSRRMPNMNVGDFRIIAYSNPAYNENFVNGTNKITSGEMFTSDNTDKVIVISSELATENELKVGDSVTFYLPSDETKTFEFKIIGIYEDTTEVESNSFMNLSAMNSRNQIYTNVTNLNEILNSSDSSTNSRNGITAKFYLNDKANLTNFENEVRTKGLSSFYNVTTNEEQILETLKPVQNISKFSFTFLIVVLVVGGLILGVINILNIRERKYEVGVLRAIGMTKLKVTMQIVAEIFIVALAALIIGTGIGTSVSQPVTNNMLKNEIQSYKDEQTQNEQNFGRGGFNRAGSGNFNRQGAANNMSTNYVDKLTVSISYITIIQLFAISLILTVISGLGAVMFINKYEPNKILQNRA